MNGLTDEHEHEYEYDYDYDVDVQLVWVVTALPSTLPTQTTSTFTS